MKHILMLLLYNPTCSSPPLKKRQVHPIIAFLYFTCLLFDQKQSFHFIESITIKEQHQQPKSTSQYNYSWWYTHTYIIFTHLHVSITCNCHISMNSSCKVPSLPFYCVIFYYSPSLSQTIEIQITSAKLMVS